MQSKAFQWIAGTAALVLVILAGGWLLLVSKTFDAAAEIDAEREQVEQGNQALEARIAMLRAQFEKIDELRAELAELRKGIPDRAELDALLDQVHDIAEEHEVTVAGLKADQAVEVGDTLSVVLTEIAEAEVGAADTPPAAETSESEEPEAEEAPAAELPKVVVEAVDGLYSIQLRLTVQGSYENVLAFLEDLQARIDRLYLVQTISAASLTEGEGGDGLPATENGDVSLETAGHVFVLVDKDAVTAPEGEEAAELPRPRGDRNPFDPVAGVSGSEGSDEDSGTSD